MITVASNIDLPIKLLFPKPNLNNTPQTFGILGLGDIVVPGLVIAVFLRFDFMKHILHKMKCNANKELLIPLNSAGFSRSYFHMGMVGYLVGIFISQIFGAIFQVPQPALLYLLPCTIFPVILLAILKGNFGEFIGWDEEFVNYKILKVHIIPEIKDNSDCPLFKCGAHIKFKSKK